MSSVEMYGIPNCDSIKKARKWLADAGVEYTFHDFKKVGISESLLRQWVAITGWEVLLNRRGMMWRKLTDEQRADMDEARAIALMLEIPSIIKRPVIVAGGSVEVGFSPERYRALFSR